MCLHNYWSYASCIGIFYLQYILICQSADGIAQNKTLVDITLLLQW